VPGGRCGLPVSTIDLWPVTLAGEDAEYGRVWIGSINWNVSGLPDFFAAGPRT